MLKESEYVKIRVAVPLENADAIREVLGKSGAGAQGNYEYCSGSCLQTGRFRPKAGAKPAVGAIGQHEEIQEEMIETICHRDKVESVIAAVRRVHPYEEPAIDIIPRLEIK